MRTISFLRIGGVPVGFGLMLLFSTLLIAQPMMSGRPSGRPGDPGTGGRMGGFNPAQFMRMDPLFAALDRDRDGAISSEEMVEAPQSLLKLDKNGDQTISGDETRPTFGRGRGGFGGFRRAGGERGAALDPEQVKFEDGAARIPDRETFKKLAYQGSEVLIDRHLDGQEFVKFQIEGAQTTDAKLYFINTKTHRAHKMFMSSVGIPMRGFGRGGATVQMRGVMVYRPLTTAPNGELGLYTYEFEPNDSYPFDAVDFAYHLLIEKMPILEGKLGYYPMPSAMARYREEKSLYEGASLPVYLDEDLFGEISFLPLNVAESYGRLRRLGPDERPSARDIVIYESLPNEMPRVAGVLSGVRQTPLSHVNLRAIQDRVPNAYVAGISNLPELTRLIGKNVYYRVSTDGYEIREASQSEVDLHYASIRPSEPQQPKRDLSVKRIRPLKILGFMDATSVGVKAANVAVMHGFGFDEFTVPTGHAIPFSFYHAFMEYNGLYREADVMLNSPEFRGDRDRKIAALKLFREKVRAGVMPAWAMAAIGQLQSSYPAQVSIRVRSSTNNEDLPSFSGAGLYDSYTHHPDEGHLAKSIKQVYASLWNFRAYEEREFYRIDHFATAMGVLVHLNYSGERANGVAVTDDILYQTYGNYYFNTQVGEDMVTNPEAASVPEEVLVNWWDSADQKVMRRSNRVAEGERILDDRQLKELSAHLEKIHREFRALYGKSVSDPFAMEIEFKVTREGNVAIKQARPWVY